jgi:hypothetical protein
MVPSVTVTTGVLNDDDRLPGDGEVAPWPDASDAGPRGSAVERALCAAICECLRSARGLGVEADD